jgi:ABC-type branched-subunit amino acid transport system ATPase component
MPADQPALRTSALTVSYGGVRALDGVSIEVPEGALVGLIGPNGAGKTTFTDALTGFTPYTGQVWLAGRSLDGEPPHARARLGLVRTFQAGELFDDLSVWGNLLVAADRPRWWSPAADLARPGRHRSPAAVSSAVETMGIGHLVDRPPESLSEGERKLVGVCRALVRSPRVLVLDEPAAGLDTAESRLLGAHLRAVVDSGVTVLLIDHDMDLVLTVCEELHVIEYGVLIASGTPAQVRTDPRVVAAYLGAAAAVPAVERSA